VSRSHVAAPVLYPCRATARVADTYLSLFLVLFDVIFTATRVRRVPSYPCHVATAPLRLLPARRPVRRVPKAPTAAGRWSARRHRAPLEPSALRVPTARRSVPLGVTTPCPRRFPSPRVSFAPRVRSATAWAWPRLPATARAATSASAAP
jgi:hypothetical protein